MLLLTVTKKFRQCIYQMVFVSVFYKLKYSEYKIGYLATFYSALYYQNGIQAIHS